MTIFINKGLIAPCGMNCGICMAYLRPKKSCPGCRCEDAGKPITRLRCKIKTCEKLLKSEIKFCYKCCEFPCAYLERLDKRYRIKYRMSMIENLQYIKGYGIRKFLAHEKKRWTCTACKQVICVHRGSCTGCGKKRI